MTRPNQIKTITQKREFKYKEKGSLFIGLTFPAENENEALSFLKSIKKEHYNATHHCYAMKFQDGEFKYSDDGEPNGTAGVRILNAIQHFDLVNLIVIVIRYYGGTKLGVGPLGKAYYYAAEEVLKECKILVKTEYTEIELRFDFALLNLVHRTLSTFNTKIDSEEYDPNPKMNCLIRKNEADNFIAALTESSNGQIEIKNLNKSIWL